jgi:hypothetical protein
MGEILKERADEFVKLAEYAYIKSIYLPAQFLKEDVDRVFEFLDKLKNLINL